MHVNLRNAYLCADCDAIGDSPVQCPACASRLGILPLITVLNRTQKEKHCTQPPDTQTPKQS